MVPVRSRRLGRGHRRVPTRRPGRMALDRGGAVTSKLAQIGAEPMPSLGLPPCPICGAAIGFAAAPGGAIEWWRCTKCQTFYPVRNSNCAHDPGSAGRCARCGGSRVAVTVTVREGGQEMTMHFCSLAHAREALDSE